MRDGDFRNYMAGDPYLARHAGINIPKKQNNFCACGLNASGGTEPEIPDTEKDLKATVQKMTAWNYAKAGLALIGFYVIARFIYTKYIKK